MLVMQAVSTAQKSNYVTLEPELGGLDYREIAEKMTAQGDVMGHSTVRNVILRVMERFACAIMGQYGFTGDPSVIAREPMFQKAIAELLQEPIRGEDTCRSDCSIT